MNKTYYRLLATKPGTIFIPYLIGVGAMTASSWIISPYSSSLFKMAIASTVVLLFGVGVLFWDKRKARNNPYLWD